MNSINVIGNLTRDPEVRYTQSGTAVSTLSIAVNKTYTKDGEKVEEVSFFDIGVFGPTAENCSKYLSKGSKIAVTGELKQDRWEKDGEKHNRVKIIANRIEFLTPKSESAGKSQSSQEEAPEGWD